MAKGKAAKDRKNWNIFANALSDTIGAIDT